MIVVIGHGGSSTMGVAKMHRIICMWLLVIFVICTATACTSEPVPTKKSGGAASSSTLGAPIDEKPTLRPLTIGATIWTSAQVQLVGIGNVALHDDMVVVQSGSNTLHPQIGAYAAATGAPLWTTTEPLTGGDGAQLFELVDAPMMVVRSGASAVVLTNYITTACTAESGFCPPGTTSKPDELGVVALSLTDGHVVWKYSTKTSAADDHLVGVSDVSPSSPQVRAICSTAIRNSTRRS